MSASPLGDWDAAGADSSGEAGPEFSLLASGGLADEGVWGESNEPANQADVVTYANIVLPESNETNAFWGGDPSDGSSWSSIELPGSQEPPGLQLIFIDRDVADYDLLFERL